MAQKKKPQSAGSDRQAKIQAAASSGAGSGANKIVIAAVAAVVAIVAVVGFVVIKQVQSDNAVKGDGQAVPAGATMGGAYPAYQDVTAKAGAPTVEAFEDFQCPGCQQFERAIGSTLVDLAKSGDIKLQYHMLNFLDQRLGNTSSLQASNGAYCAADAGPGKFEEYHTIVYANAPEQEGTGWTAAQLKDYAQQAGLTGDALKTWESCFELGKYTNYNKAVDANAFGKEGIKGTPTFKINGTIIDNKTFATPDQVKAAVAAATK